MFRMKKIPITLLSMLVVLCVDAQKRVQFKQFKVDLSLGYAMPQGSGSKGGALLAVEPKYEILDQLSVGMRIEIAAMARGYETASGSTSSDLEVKASGSYLLTGDYYITDNYSFRPFAGAGLGSYSLAAGSTANGGSVSSEVESKFGQMIRVGFEAGHFRLGIEYNFVPDTELTYFSGSSNIKSTSKNSYLGIKLGVVFGGGRK
jgi:outer membrane protein W